MKTVYICSPLKAYGTHTIDDNIRNAREYSKWAMKDGVVAVAPHLLFTQFLDDGKPDEREIGITAGLELMRRCDEVWVFGHYHSRGMQEEIKEAIRLKIPLAFILFDSMCNEQKENATVKKQNPKADRPVLNIRKPSKRTVNNGKTKR